MSIFSITYSDLWNTLNPPILRQPRQLAWGTSLLKPVQYLRDLIFNDYADGSPYALYSGATTYNQFDRVVHIDRGVYENLSGSTGVNPFDANTWRKINDNYIGARERVKYNSQKKLFEYALNRWFLTGVNNPSPYHGIFIQTLTASTNIFLMGQTGQYSSTMPNSGQLAQDYMSNSYQGINNACYIIMVPLSAYTALASTNTERENIIRSFADDYNLAGMMYSVSGY